MFNLTFRYKILDLRN